MMDYTVSITINVIHPAAYVVWSSFMHSFIFCNSDPLANFEGSQIRQPCKRVSGKVLARLLVTYHRRSLLMLISSIQNIGQGKSLTHKHTGICYKVFCHLQAIICLSQTEQHHRRMKTWSNLAQAEVLPKDMRLLCKKNNKIDCFLYQKHDSIN